MKIISILIFLFTSISLSHSESYIGWGGTSAPSFSSGTNHLGNAYNCVDICGAVTTDIFSIDATTGAVNFIRSWNAGFTTGIYEDPPGFGSGTFLDSASGYLYAKQVNGMYKVFDTNNNGALVLNQAAPSWSLGSQTLNLGGSNIMGMSRIVDSEGKNIIKKEDDGSIHIGENSLVTFESNGQQQLYATDSSGSRIDINIPSGTNLLINGTNIMSGIQQNISGSVALSSALAALPNSSPDAFYACGLGTGIHDSSSALSAGCASDFSNYAFTDNLPKIFQTASFNIGSSFLMNGEPDLSEVRDMSIKAGITFKFGSVKPTRVADDRNYMLENKIDAVMAENDLLKAQIAEINTQLKALNMLAMN